MLKTLESRLGCKEIEPVNPKGNQPWIFIRRTDAEAEAPILWPPDVKSQPIRKDPDAGKDWRQEEKGTTEDKMVGWHHQLDGHEFVQAPGDGGGQGSLVWCSPWGRRESDNCVTEQQQQQNLANLISNALWQWGKVFFKCGVSSHFLTFSPSCCLTPSFSRCPLSPVLGLLINLVREWRNLALPGSESTWWRNLGACLKSHGPTSRGDWEMAAMVFGPWKSSGSTFAWF